MHTVIAKAVSTAALSTFLAGYGLASPPSSQLLPLVPPGAEVVAGFQNHAHPHGRLLLTTHNDRLDLEDWQALTGADSRRVFDEIIEVAASGAGGKISEHLLLVAGRFDREKIFHSLEENGAQATDFEGQQVRVIEPLARERGDMLDTRLLVILEDRIGMFGTPALVRQAMRRYAAHAVPDPVLEERLRLVRSDVTSWNVLSGRAGRKCRIEFAQPQSAWAELQQDTELLLVGARFGSKVRIDFSIYGKNERGAEFYGRKASFFTTALVAGPAPQMGRSGVELRAPQNYLVGANHVEGSVELSERQFEAWCEELSRLRAPDVQGPPRGN